MTEIPCVISHNNDETVAIHQDNATLLKERYQVRQIVSFKVKNDFSYNGQGIYELIDDYGFTTYIEKKDGIQLYKNQRVECRVLAIDRRRPIVELVNVTGSKEGAFSIGAKDILERMPGSDWDVDAFIRLLLTNEMEETFETSNQKWLAGMTRSAADLPTVRQDLCTLLELSDLLDKCGAEERTLFQDRLSLIIENISHYMQAVELTRQEEEDPESGPTGFLDRLMEKLRLSGYVYHPKKNLHIMSSLFLLRPELMDRKIEDLFDAIRGHDLKTWTKEPFRGSLIELLEMYVREAELKVNLSSTQERLVKNMIRALAIQLLLAGTEEENLPDVTLNRAKLYRYISYLNVPDPQYAIDLAYENLLDISSRFVAYSLNKTGDPYLLGHILVTPRLSLSEEMDTNLIFIHENVQLKIRRNGLRFLPLKEVKGCKNVVPASLLPWREIEVLLPKGTRTEVKENNLTDIYPYQRMWAEIDRDLFGPAAEKTVKVSKRKMKRVGMDVRIRIYRQDDYNPDKFYCRIENEEERGTIELKPDIVRYNVNANVESFYSENGYPLWLEATLVDFDEDGSYVLSMRDQIDGITRDFAAFADTITCSIGHYDARSQTYVGISKEGFSVAFPHQGDMPQLQKFDIVLLEDITLNHYGSLTGSFLRKAPAGELFSSREAFHRLMIIHGNDEEYKGEIEREEEEALQSDTMIESVYVAELMMNIDRIASLEPNYIRAYNYLGVARMLARMLEQESREKYYKGRMDLLVMLHDFAINDEVDEKRLKALEAVNVEEIKNYELLYYRFKQLKIVSRLNHPEHNNELWDRKEETAGHVKLQELASLVLAHNILRTYGLDEQADDVHNKIKNQLRLRVWKSTLKDYGETEDLRTEFKSSLIYAAGSMKADAKKQMQVILTVIASMLNSAGGKLYLGVNNEGAGVGLEEDLKHPMFAHDKDKYQLYLHEAILKAFGKVISAHIRIGFDQENTRKDVCVVEIEPYREGVRFENTWYIRQSSRKVVMNAKEFEQYNEHRKKTLVYEVKPVVAEAGKTAPAAPKKTRTPKKPTAPQPIKTGKFRYINRSFEHEGCGYIHFLTSGTYKLSEHPMDGTLLSAPLLRSDEFLVIAYENGSVVRIPVEELQKREPDQEYPVWNGERILFACPAKKVEALLTIFKIKDDRYMRVDYLSRLPQGTIEEEAEKLFKEEIDQIEVCEILPSGSKDSFRNAKNLSTVGWLLKGKPGEKAILKLADLGISTG